METSYLTAGSYSKDFIDAFSFTSNPACLGSLKNTTVGLLAERKWMLRELDSYLISSCFSVGQAAIGISFQHSGDENLNETNAMLGYGKKLGRLELGVYFGYLLVQTQGYGSTGFGSSGIGIRYTVSEKLITGWEIGLPLFGTLGNSQKERGPQIFRMGMGYQPGPDILLVFQIEKQAGLPLCLTGSVDYKYSNQFFFSFGINGSAGSPYFKTGWKKNQISVMLYIEYQTVLGFSPGLVFIWTGKNKKR